MAKRFLFNAALATVLFLILFFLSAVIFSQVLLKSEIVSVPDLTGKPVGQARSELQKKDLTLAQKGTESSDRLDKGLIVRQDPAAVPLPELVKTWTTRVTRILEPAAVPDLAG